MSTAQQALLYGVISALGASTAIQDATGGRIYDLPPPGAPYPFLQVRLVAGQPWDTDTTADWEARVQVDAWTRAGGSLSVIELQAAIYGALHDADIALVGHRTVLGRLATQQVIPEPDGETAHGVQQFRFFIEEA